MTLYEQTKKYGSGKGEAAMWETVRTVSDAFEKFLSDEEKTAVMRKIYNAINGGHYNEEYALEDVKKMYYVDKEGNKRYAPYWSVEEVKNVYSAIKASLPPEYNFWDFYVTLQMIKSDYCPLITKWFAGEEMPDREEKIVELAVCWLKDEDNPFGKEKIWRYLNSGE